MVRGAVLCVKNFSRDNVVAFLFKTSDARVVLCTPGLSIGVTLIDTRIDIVWKSQKDCLSLLTKIHIRHKRTPQCIPYHKRVAGRTLDILYVKAIAVLLGVTIYVDDLSNIRVTENRSTSCETANSPR